MKPVRDDNPVLGSITVSNLSISTRGKSSTCLVENLNLVVTPGEIIGLVGESGSGKSLTLRAILGILPPGIQQSGGTVNVEGRVGMVFQDPLTALDPLEKIGKQIADSVLANSRLGWGREARVQAKKRALDLMSAVRLPQPDERYHWYPHQLSGGQRQRVVIAIALATSPDILLCDEPTTALDVTVQQQVLKLLQDLHVERRLTIVFVSHNLAVVSGICSRMAVMSHGKIIESGPTLEVLNHPQEQYTRMLIDSVLPLPDEDQK